MLLKHLINPKPSILIFFLIFCVIINSTPILVNVENINTLYGSSGFNKYLFFLLSMLIPFFIGNGLNNMIYEKNVLKKDIPLIGQNNNEVFKKLGYSYSELKSYKKKNIV